MSIETLRTLIDKYGAHSTLSDVMARECAELIRTKLGLPLDASDAQVDASLAQQFSEVCIVAVGLARQPDDANPAA